MIIRIKNHGPNTIHVADYLAGGTPVMIRRHGFATVASNDGHISVTVEPEPESNAKQCALEIELNDLKCQLADMQAVIRYLEARE